MAHPNIELRTNTVVEEVLGVEENEVKGLRLRDVTTGANEQRSTSKAFSSASATSPTPKCLPARSISTTTATS